MLTERASQEAGLLSGVSTTPPGEEPERLPGFSGQWAQTQAGSIPPPNGCKTGKRAGEWQANPAVPPPLGITLRRFRVFFPSKEEPRQCPSCKGKYSDLVGLSGLPLCPSLPLL